jgi:hypothetical protein
MTDLRRRWCHDNGLGLRFGTHGPRLRFDRNRCAQRFRGGRRRGHDRQFGDRRGSGLCGLDQPRRGHGGGCRLWRLRCTARRLFDSARGHRRVGVRRVRRHLDSALTSEAADEFPRHHFLDRARRALHLDAVIALQESDHFLTRRVEQLCDLVNPNCCQIVPLVARGLCPAVLRRAAETARYGPAITTRGFHLPPTREALRRTAIALAEAGQVEDSRYSIFAAGSSAATGAASDGSTAWATAADAASASALAPSGSCDSAATG